MYVPKPFQVDDHDALCAAIRTHPFGLLTSPGPDGVPAATHVPFLLTDGAPMTLVTHLARANPQARALQAGPQVRVVFSGPHGYVSPTWYANPAQVPTWNYVAVHAIGRATITEAADRLQQIVTNLARDYEGAGDAAWSFHRLPESLQAGLLRSIIGVEITVDRLIGAWKLSQNKSTDDRTGVIAALEATGQADDARLAQAMRACRPT